MSMPYHAIHATYLAIIVGVLYLEWGLAARAAEAGQSNMYLSGGTQGRSAEAWSPAGELQRISSWSCTAPSNKSAPLRAWRLNGQARGATPLPTLR